MITVQARVPPPVAIDEDTIMRFFEEKYRVNMVGFTKTIDDGSETVKYVAGYLFFSEISSIYRVIEIDYSTGWATITTIYGESLDDTIQLIEKLRKLARKNSTILRGEHKIDEFLRKIGYKGYDASLLDDDYIWAPDLFDEPTDDLLSIYDISEEYLDDY